MKKGLIFLFSLMLLTSCGDYNKILKSTDYEMKYEYAKKYYDEGKYTRAYTILEDILPVFRGTSRAEEALYLIAQSYYGAKDYETAGQYFTTYYTSYPRGEFSELARYFTGYGYYLDSPDPRLDQAGTYKAINEFQLFLDYYPKSDKAEEAQKILFELQDKLAEKELLSTRLYYNLGDYLGNNYESAVITADNALKEYPYTKYKEEFHILILRSRYEEATRSVEEKREERLREVIDEYYTYLNEFPEGKHLKEAKKIYESASKKIND